MGVEGGERVEADDGMNQLDQDATAYFAEEYPR